MIIAHKYHLQILLSWDQIDMDVLSINAKEVFTLVPIETDDFIINIDVQLLERDFQEVKDNFICKVLD